MKTLSVLASSFILSTAMANTAVTSTNKLGLKFALETAKMVKNENFMISPISLHQALTLAANGTSNGTRHEVEQLLGDDLENLNASSSSLVKALSFSPAQKKQMTDANRYANPAVVAINNGIWHTNNKQSLKFEFSQEFKDVASEFYGASSAALDFKAKGASDVLNKWADEKTYGLVKNIISDDILKDLKWVIMNASYIEAAWPQPFYKLGENSPQFELTNKSKIRVPMIGGKQYIRYAQEADGSELALIPFNRETGAPALEMVIMLPARDVKLAAAQQKFFDQKAMNELLDGKKALTHAEARLTLPKFSFDTSVEMKHNEPLTRAMGINFLFGDYAQFGRIGTMDSVSTAIGLIKQNSRIELDEKGVKAAAVTLIGGVRTTSVPREPSINMVVDRPFLFAIIDTESKAVLFAGSVVDPR